VRRFLLALAALAAAGGLALAALWRLLPDPAPLARAAPRTTALVEQRRVEAQRAGRAFRPVMVWTPLERIAPRLVEAVLLAEDASFYAHAGFDAHEIRAALEARLERGRALRGASTLSQQLAKNLWLGTERSAWRKAREAVLTVKLERALGKRRILALYLNVAEWGDGVFGAEAGARARFGVAAADLTTAQAALLAAMLPAPRRADLARPPRWLAARARRLLDRLRDAGRVDPSEHAHASAELERLLRGVQGDEQPPDDGA
jgi:monofunctional biosynthetic peptidoglycan transglycosylase